jgi:hypothetical protein
MKHDLRIKVNLTTSLSLFSYQSADNPVHIQFRPVFLSADNITILHIVTHVNLMGLFYSLGSKSSTLRVTAGSSIDFSQHCLTELPSYTLDI